MLSAVDGSESGTDKYDSSDRCSVSDNGHVHSCDEKLSNEVSGTDKAIDVISEELQRKINQLEKENIKLRKENNELKSTVFDLEAKCSRMYSYSDLEILLSPIISKTQLNAILNKRKVKHWPDEDISAAFTLRSFSPKCYEYLRTKRGFPLPCKTTLNERAKNFSCEPGILKSVLSIMKMKSDSFTHLEKLAVISLDEMSISSEWCYDKGNDTLYKPHERVQVVMLSGLVGKWKQPIFYAFDVADMYQNIIMLIEEAEHAGYPVVALVHDLVPSNIKMWKQLGIDPMETKKTSFKNPLADRDVYVFADVPHLIKLIRNNLVDSGFYLKDGSFISDACIREMLTATKTEYGLAYKLSEMHLNVSGHQRQRVKFATQLLSNTCSSSISYLGEKGLLVNRYWKETAEFINMVDQWFDIMNSSHKFGDKRSRNAFGVNLCEQVNVLHRIAEVISTMRVKHAQRKGLYMFQKGVVLSSHSLIGLHNMLRKSFGVEYILTRKLNQDNLEHLFGCIRQMHGPYEHPNAITVKFRLKKLLLGKDVALLSEKANVTTDNLDCLSTSDGLMKTNNERKTFCERDLAVELYITSNCFKDLDVGCELENAVDDEIDDGEHGCKSIDVVIEEESLRYIGGYIVRKFCVKYPHLGQKASECVTKDKRWTDEVNRGELYAPSELFYSHLTIMREVFQTVHGVSLQAGKECFKKIVSEIECAGVDLPNDVIAFFAKISVFFKIRKLNNDIRINKKKAKTCRSESKKHMKVIM